MHALAQLAGPAFIVGLWQGTLLAAAVWLCLRLVPQAAASLRFALWTAVLLVVCILPVVETLHPRQIARNPPLPALHLDPRLSLALAALWATVSLLRGADLALQSHRLRSLRRQAIPVNPTDSLQHLLAAGKRPVELCTSSLLDRPGVIGFFAPRILIPDWLYPQLTAPELEQIILHEFEHLRRRDDWLNLFQKLALVLFPLNPILIAIERHLCRERELACDDGVLRRTRAPRAYATCLATLAERGLTHRSLSLALGALGTSRRGSELYRRVHRILSRHTSASPLHARALTATVALVLLGGAAALARCPQLVSFAEPPATLLSGAAPPSLPASPLANALPPTLHTVSLPATAKRKPRLTRAAAHLPASPKTHLLLTAWPETAHARLVTLNFDLPTYTAIRIDGGWLFLQL